MIAELVEDGGEAAFSSEFFRCPEFLGAEGATHTLVISSAGTRASVPVIVRPIPGAADRHDAVSPYGFPGASLQHGEPPDPAAVDWSATGLVSVFVRDRVGEPSLAGGRERSRLQIADPGRPPKSRMSDRQQIRRNLRRGYAVEVTSGPESSDADRRGFERAYEQTMVRTDAGERYFFGSAYFDRVLSSPRTWLFVVRAPEGGVAAGSIAARSDAHLHYFLSGTADDHLRGSPMKNILAEMASLGAELGLPLNLGGGVTPGDRLEQFKRGFANAEAPFRTHEIVCDREAYEELCATAGAGGEFFPAYRA